MNKTLRDIILSCTLTAVAISSGCNLFGKRIPTAEEIEVHEKTITGTVLNEGRTSSGGYFIIIQTPDGKTYQAGRLKDNGSAEKILGKPLAQVDKEVNKGDIVSAEISLVGTSYEKPDFNKYTTLVGIKKH